MSQPRLAVFISGQGTNLEVILRNQSKFADIFVVSSSEEAFGLERAKRYDVESLTLDGKINWFTLEKQLEERGTEMIFLAGFMKIVPTAFLESWQHPIYNLHPSMLPKYKGLKAIKRAFDDGHDMGVTIHHVVPEVDSGSVVLQEVAVSSDELKDMDYKEAELRVHQKEHHLVQAWVDLVTS